MSSVLGGFEVLECVLDDLVVAHRGAAGDQRVGGFVAQVGADAFEDPYSCSVDAGKVADLGERPASKCADKRRGGFGTSELDEGTEGPIERGGELGTAVPVTSHGHRLAQRFERAGGVSES